MAYVDLAVYAVPTSKRDEFEAHARKIAPIFKKHGALTVADCWGNDIPDGEVTSLPMAVKAGADETVAFSWITWADKASRDAGMGQAMGEMQSELKDSPMPFDGKRLIFGGFETVVEL
ncbi:MAG: DUF1428 domain-containing protein [Hyphomicrobiaceae bacterium]